MNEHFKFAATRLLKRRLKSFISINNNIEIDKNYITYAEYQLFINEMEALGKNRQPDHWIMNKFSPENAVKPIVGVRASDAQEFCEWLNNKYPLLGHKYRLPTLEEIAIKPSLENQIGCWCVDEKQLIIGGINLEQWQIWQEKLKKLLKFEEDIGQYSYFNLDNILAWKINLNFDFSSQHFQIVTLAEELSIILINEFNNQLNKYSQSSLVKTLIKKFNDKKNNKYFNKYP
ncbi:MAG: SUMF1/EgtB/PvdO family nonheme iron enzyme [Hydrococcus sp. SU_1_0]|nr:SUMF1/EgtB/PvdO family nonheme iron enzyme [Hydrococcus sp. SU_1_0]